MGPQDQHYRVLEEIIRTSEILAVARALSAGNAVHVGEQIDYFIEPEALRLPVKAGATQAGRPYRTEVQQWHLDRAHSVLQQWRAKLQR